MQLLLQIEFWLTPIVCQEEKASFKPRGLFALNPQNDIVRGYRESLIDHVWFYRHPSDCACFRSASAMLVGVGGVEGDSRGRNVPVGAPRSSAKPVDKSLGHRSQLGKFVGLEKENAGGLTECDAELTRDKGRVESEMFAGQMHAIADHVVPPQRRMVGSRPTPAQQVVPTRRSQRMVHQHASGYLDRPTAPPHPQRVFVINLVDEEVITKRADLLPRSKVHE